MGLTIHYSGQLKQIADLPKLTSEVQEICETMAWEYSLVNFEEEKPPAVIELLGLPPGEPLRLNGIHFQPHPESETVYMVFDQKGRLCMPINLLMATEQDDPEMLWYVFTKTQFAGPETHMIVVRLLKYLDSRYLTNFTVLDEGEYWETGDETKLRQLFSFLAGAINAVANAIEGANIPPGLSADDLMDQIEEILKKFGDKEKE